MNNEVILGTAKLGIPDYGFPSANSYASPNELLKKAKNSGVDTLDTSPRYGDAEKLIGIFHNQNKSLFKICTKVDNLNKNDKHSERNIFKSVEKSIARTQVSQIEILYLHQNEMEIISDHNILMALDKLKVSGIVKKVGASVYSNEECEFSLNNNVYDVIQAPISILDTYMYSELLETNKNKCEIIARSVFLQGTLFNRGDIRSKIHQSESMLQYLSQIDYLVDKHGLNLLNLACSFVLALPHVTNIIIGTASQNNLLKIMEVVRAQLPKELFGEVKALSDQYKEWTNPRNW